MLLQRLAWGAAGEQQLRDEIIGAEAIAPVGGKAAPMPGLAENRVGNAEDGGHASRRSVKWSVAERGHR